MSRKTNPEKKAHKAVERKHWLAEMAEKREAWAAFHERTSATRQLRGAAPLGSAVLAMTLAMARTKV